MTQHDPDALDAVIFPGGEPSRRARAERAAPKPKTPAEREPAWDDYPQEGVLKDENVVMYLVGALAMALGVTPKAIYKWEQQRIMPPARYRTKPPVYKDRPTIEVQIPGKKPAGRRLYTREQIEAVIEAAREANVAMPRQIGTRPDWRLFTSLVVRSWLALD